MTTRDTSTMPFIHMAACIAVACGMDALVKQLSTTTGLVHILSLRYFFGAVIAIAFYMAPKQLADGSRVRRGWPSKASFGFQILRSTLLVISAYLFFYGLLRLNLATATTLGFTAALMVPLLAWPFLKERPSMSTFGLSVLGFGGAALAVSGQSYAAAPASGLSQSAIGTAAVLLAALLYAAVLILLRLRAGQDGPITTALFSNVVPAILLLPLYLATDGVAASSQAVLLVTALLGVMGYSMWYLMTLAYAAAPAQQLTPFEYSGLIWASAIGYVFFDEHPTWHLWAGGAIIIATCLAIAAQTHYATRKATRMPLSETP